MRSCSWSYIEERDFGEANQGGPDGPVSTAKNIRRRAMIDRRLVLMLTLLVGAACSSSERGRESGPIGSASPPTAAQPAVKVGDRKYLLERVDDAAVVQLYADGFEHLPLNEKVLVWHLQRAAIAGRDIYYDQRYRHSLEMRDLIEEVLTHADGVEPSTLAAIQRYAKLFWLNNGPYNYNTSRKFTIPTTPQAFASAVHQSARNGASFRLLPGESLDTALSRLQPL